jgi:hypothetical protein
MSPDPAVLAAYLSRPSLVLGQHPGVAVTPAPPAASAPSDPGEAATRLAAAVRAAAGPDGRVAVLHDGTLAGTALLAAAAGLAPRPAVLLADGLTGAGASLAVETMRSVAGLLRGADLLVLDAAEPAPAVADEGRGPELDPAVAAATAAAARLDVDVLLVPRGGDHLLAALPGAGHRRLADRWREDGLAGLPRVGRRWWARLQLAAAPFAGAVGPPADLLPPPLSAAAEAWTAEWLRRLLGTLAAGEPHRALLAARLAAPSSAEAVARSRPGRPAVRSPYLHPDLVAWAAALPPAARRAPGPTAALRRRALLAGLAAPSGAPVADPAARPDPSPPWPAGDGSVALPACHRAGLLDRPSVAAGEAPAAVLERLRVLERWLAAGTGPVSDRRAAPARP